MTQFLQLKDNILYDIQRRLPPYADTADLTKELGWVPCAKERKLLFLLLKKANKRR